MSKLVLQADRFAAAAHSAIDHRRKYSGEPYIEHPREVAQLVASVTNDEEVIAAALLHDTVEDTPVTLEQIEFEFGRRIAVLVEQLTDVSRPEDGNRRARKALDLAHTAKASPEAKTVKLADLISNTRSIVAHDPDFARVYLAEKARLLEVLTEGDAGLFGQASLLLTETRQRLADQKNDQIN